MSKRFTFRIQQQWAGGGDIRIGGKIIYKRLIPSRKRNSIVVEEDEELSFGQTGPDVGGWPEIQVSRATGVPKGLTEKLFPRKGQVLGVTSDEGYPQR